MKNLFKTIIYIFTCIILIGCNTYKSARKTLIEGNYDKVITQMTTKYKRGVKEKNKRKLLSILQEAYLKANARDLETVSRQKKSQDVSRYKSIYLSYNQIQQRQDNIKPLLPLELNGRAMDFPIKDYSSEIEKYKKSYAKQLNNQAEDLLERPTKQDAQRAHGLLMTLQSLYPNYTNLTYNLNRAYREGTTFTYIEIRNSSEYLMPKSIDEDLRTLDTKYLNKNWHEYHSTLQRGMVYDYDVLIDVEDVFVSPEMVSRKQFISEKEIIDGWEYKKDESGNFVLDSLDNKIRLDRIKIIRAEVNELHHDKNALMVVKVAIINNKTNHIETTRSFESNRFYSDFSCEIQGDNNALDENYRKTIKTKITPFPSDIDLLYDCTQEIKDQVKSFLRSKQ